MRDEIYIINQSHADTGAHHADLQTYDHPLQRRMPSIGL